MGLDYTKGAVNFRDLGVWLNEIEGHQLLPSQQVFRGGKLDFVNSLSDIGNPHTLLNLRRGVDPEFGVFCAHIFVAAGIDTNQTPLRSVRQWLNEVMLFFADPNTKYPVYMHCTSGKDRTGVVAGVLGLVVGAKLSTIETEYSLSDGKLQPTAFREALLHIYNSPIDKYLNRVDLDSLRARLLCLGR